MEARGSQRDKRTTIAGMLGEEISLIPQKAVLCARGEMAKAPANA
jgi:hypothetical protein